MLQKDETEAEVFDYVKRFYNPKRRHSTIVYLSPMEFERKARLTHVRVNETGRSPVDRNAKTIKAKKLLKRGSILVLANLSNHECVS
jgi:hypothetical protein